MTGVTLRADTAGVFHPNKQPPVLIWGNGTGLEQPGSWQKSAEDDYWSPVRTHTQSNVTCGTVKYRTEQNKKTAISKSILQVQKSHFTKELKNEKGSASTVAASQHHAKETSKWREETAHLEGK